MTDGALFFEYFSSTLLICCSTLTTPSSSFFGAPNLSSIFAARPLADGADSSPVIGQKFHSGTACRRRSFVVSPAAGFWTASQLQAKYLLSMFLFFFCFSHPPLQLHGWIRDESRQEAAEGSLLSLLFSPLFRRSVFTCGLSFRNTTACLLNTHVFNLCRGVFDSPIIIVFSPIPHLHAVCILYFLIFSSIVLNKLESLTRRVFPVRHRKSRIKW